jgi:aryl-alcohol dehydrogenase-like predicted oxidoreductase/enamine deaminase RidA (YjgF/YER057c/UK114 family)
MSLKNKTILSKSLSIPKLIVGLWQIADMEKEDQQLDLPKTASYMDAYIDAGFTAFDMADHYGSSEIIAGICKNRSPKKDVITMFTKWVPKPGKITKDQVRSAVQKALDRMDQKTIDLMQFHAWDYTDPSWLDGLTFLNELKKEGLIDNIGVTNFDAHHLRIALANGIPIVSNQISHSLIDQRAQGAMKAVCAEYDVKLLAYGTLAGGFLSNRWLGLQEPSSDELGTWSQMKYKRFIDQIGGWTVFQSLLRVLQQIAIKHQTTIASIASSYVLQNKDVAAVIVGARLGENSHIDDHQNMLNIVYELQDIESIETALSQLLPIPGNCGDEYRKPPFLTASGDLTHHLDHIPSVYTPEKISEQKEAVSSGTEWETLASYSRAIKKGNQIHVSGTTATHQNEVVGGQDAAAQTHFVIDKIEAAIASLGGSLDDVVRTRIFVNNIKDWEPVAQAHGFRFKGINPANTLVEAKLVGNGYLVEIEAEATLDT